MYTFIQISSLAILIFWLIFIANHNMTAVTKIDMKWFVMPCELETAIKQK